MTTTRARSSAEFHVGDELPRFDLNVISTVIVAGAITSRDFMPAHQDQRVAQGLCTAGFHLVNAVPLVCEAPEPGRKTYLDLPMITGCLGGNEAARP